MAPKSKSTDITADSEFMRSVRGQKLLGRAAFAKLIGVSIWYVKGVEQGYCKLSPRVRRIIESLGTRIDEEEHRKSRYGITDANYSRSKRQFLKMTQRQFALSCGVSLHVIQNIEARRSLISTSLRRTMIEVALLGEI